MSTNKKSSTMIVSIGAAILLAVAVMLITTSYFNSKTIQLGADGCNKVGGSFHLEIHNPLTNSYSFECKKL